ncbi:hypothetical protein IAU59_005484 [Kwoniella sp. CBS 9459]
MHPYRPFPSPATPNTLPTPQKRHPSYGFPSVSNHGGQTHIHAHSNSLSHSQSHTQPQLQSLATMHTARQTSAGSSRTNHPDYSESESDGDEGKMEKDKLELRREKNRVKQRNLRLRRANHIAELERNLSNLRAEHASIQSSCSHLQQRESNLQGWVHDLESALFRNGLAGEVETLRRIWADRDTPKGPRGSMSHPPPQVQSHPHPQVMTPSQSHAQRPTPVDPLSTLASAAASSAPEEQPPLLSTADRRTSYSSQGGSDRRPNLPRPTSFSTRGFENPYPTPDLGWGSQMSEWPHQFDLDKKRKRDSVTEYLPSGRPLAHPMSGRMSESNVNTLAPIQSHSQSSPSIRPLSAPYGSQPPPPLSAVPSTSTSVMSASNVSPKSIRISDLLSPRPSFVTEPQSLSASTSFSGSEHLPEGRYPIDRRVSRDEGWSCRRSSRGESSVNTPESDPWQRPEDGHAPARFEPSCVPERQRNETTAVEVWSGPGYGESSHGSSGFQGTAGFPTGLAKDVTHAQSLIVPYGDRQPFSPLTPQSQGSATGWWTGVAHSPTEIGMISPTPHPSVYTARICLLSLLPQAIDPVSPPSLPPLAESQQQIILTALSNLSPPHVAEQFRASQLRDLIPDDAKLLLEYQSSLHSDVRLVLFPIAILRAAVIRVSRSDPTFDLTTFISSTLREAIVFGDPLDPDAWEMPETFWDRWENYFPLGREYCSSIASWRRRDGHAGSSVVEMILGTESGHTVVRGEKRRKDRVGKPPGWKFPKPNSTE